MKPSKSPQHAARNWLVLASLIALLFCGGATLSYQVYRSDKAQAQGAQALEMQLLASVLNDMLKTGNYQDIDHIIKSWGAGNPTVVAVKLTARSGLVLGKYHRHDNPNAQTHALDTVIDYSYRGRAKLELEEDLSTVDVNALVFAAQLGAGIAFVSVLLALLLKTNLRREKAEAELQQEKEKIEVTLQSIVDAVITTDLAGVVQHLNPATEQLTGWRNETATGKQLSDVIEIIDERTREPIIFFAPEGMHNEHGLAAVDHGVLLGPGGREHAVEASLAPILNTSGDSLGWVFVFRDVTEKRQLQHRIVWQAAHDPLTGLPNRALLADRLAQAMAHADRHKKLLAVCFADLDGFKAVNDRFGHDMGDKLLGQVGVRFLEVVRGNDTVARIGGDEFILLLTELSDLEELDSALKRAQQALTAPYIIEGETLQISASIGVTVYPQDRSDADTLLRHADHAMYISKQQGRNCVQLFNPEHAKQQQSWQLQASEISRALKDGEMRVWYQPKINLRTGEIIGFEALLRWQHPQRGLLGPREFLPAIEMTDVIIEIGEWVMHETLTTCANWNKEGIKTPISVNIAARHFQRADFVDRLRTILAAHPDAHSGALELEVLESTALHDVVHVGQVIEACQELNISFALDDFGTGYSSLAHLKQLPTSALKIDQSFVRNMLSNPSDRALVQGIVGLASVFSLAVIAEGVESNEQGVLLMRLGCDLAQGFAIAKAMPREVVPGWTREFQPDPSWSEWGQSHWDLEDLPLLSTILEHTLWLQELSRALDQPGHLPAHGEMRAAQTCQFSHWCTQRAKLRYGYLDEYQTVETMHTELHDLAAQLITVRQLGNVIAARARLPLLVSKQAQFIDALQALKQKVLAQSTAHAIAHEPTAARTLYH